jgi:hypothetical protein
VIDTALLVKTLNETERTVMNKVFKMSTIAVMAVIAAAALSIGAAHAGYYDAFGVYHPTCVWTIFGTYCG